MTFAANAGEAPETAPVEVRLLGIDKVHGARELIALCVAVITIADVELMIQGIQVRRCRNGRLEMRPPEFRSSTGAWFPSIILPPVVLTALAEAFDEHSDPRR